MTWFFLLGLSSAVHLMLVAAGFWLVLRGQAVFSFAHATSYTLGAFVASALPENMDPWARVALGAATSCLFGFVVELLVFNPLRHRKASSGQLVLASLALFVIGQGVISAVFHNEIRRIENLSLFQAESNVGFRSGRAASLDVVVGGIVLCSILLMTLYRTSWGRSVRAIAADALLAQCIGIRVGVTRLIVASVAAGFCGTAGILWAIGTAVSPQMGLSPLLLAAVATVTAGRGAIGKTLFLAGLIGVLDQGVMLVFARGWHDAALAVAFGASLISEERRGAD